MALDSGVQDGAKNQEIDLDELEVEILILGKNVNSLNQAGGFLSRRGWPTTVLTSISKAVEHIADKKPDFVLISFSLPNPAVLKLPELITQTFNLSCIGFVESLDTASTSKLNNFRMRHKVQGMPSGPNLHRTIRKLLAERFNIGTEGERSSEGGRERDSESSNVTVRGGAGTMDSAKVVGGKGAGLGTQVIKNGRSEGTEDANSGSTMSASGGPSGKMRLSQADQMAKQNSAAAIIPSEGNEGSGEQGGRGSEVKPTGAGDANVVATTDSVSTGKYTMSKRTRKSLKDLKRGAVDSGESGLHVMEGDSPGGMSASGGAEGGADLAAMLKRSLFGEGGEDINQESESSAGQVFGASSAASKANDGAGGTSPDAKRDVSSGAGTPGAASNGLGAQSAADANSETSSDGEQSSSIMGGYSNKAVDRAPLLESLAPQQIALLEPVQLLERAVATVLTGVSQNNPAGGSRRELQRLTKVAVFPLDSEAVPGYLVFGVEEEPAKVADLFVRNCDEALRREFAAMNVPAVLEAAFWVLVPPVSFQHWTSEKARFQIMVPFNQAQVGAGFFPLPSALPKAQELAEHKEMMAIDIDHISTGQPVNFKAYLHLKKNKRYFLYLRNGRQLQPEQKERLKGKQVQKVFMKTVDAENLRMFLAASFLRDTIKKTA